MAIAITIGPESELSSESKAGKLATSNNQDSGETTISESWKRLDS
ncbi:hypothetical protein AB3M80_30470 [Arthrospira platensis BEA 1257B]